MVLAGSVRRVSETLTRRIAVVVNPVKFPDVALVEEQIGKVCVDHGWSEPLMIETTRDDPGVSQGHQALEAGVDVVCSLGGDGTVRGVATALVGTDTPLGLLPGGTGNLLARNLGLPLDKLESALQVVLTGSTRRIDVGLVRFAPDSSSEEALKGDAPATSDDPRRDDEEVFLVMAGIGVDAQVMAATSDRVKGVIGWPAYVIAGLARLWDHGFRVSVRTDGDRDARQRHARTLIVGNCGSLQGNLELMPDASLEDGRLDAVILSPHGFFGWAAVAADLGSRHTRGHRAITRMTATQISAVTGQPVEAQVDGDAMGLQQVMSTRVLPQALSVCIP